MRPSLHSSETAQAFPVRGDLADLAAGVKAQAAIDQQQARGQALEHGVEAGAEAALDVRSAQVRDGDGQGLAGRDAVEAEGPAGGVAPVHRRDHPTAFVLPEARHPVGAVGLPELHCPRQVG